MSYTGSSATMTPIAAPPERTVADVAATRPVAWTPGVELRAGRIVLGGSPWQVTHLTEDMRAFARRAHAAETAGDHRGDGGG